MITILPASLWAILALLIVAYVAFGIPGVMGIAVVGFLLRNLR